MRVKTSPAAPVFWVKTFVVSAWTGVAVFYTASGILKPDRFISIALLAGFWVLALLGFALEARCRELEHENRELKRQVRSLQDPQ